MIWRKNIRRMSRTTRPLPVSGNQQRSLISSDLTNQTKLSGTSVPSPGTNISSSEWESARPAQPPPTVSVSSAFWRPDCDFSRCATSGANFASAAIQSELLHPLRDGDDEPAAGQRVSLETGLVGGCEKRFGSLLEAGRDRMFREIGGVTLATRWVCNGVRFG